MANHPRKASPRAAKLEGSARLGAVGGALVGGVAGNMLNKPAAPSPQPARGVDSNATGSILNGTTLGAVGGAVVGGVAGNKLAGKKNRTLGTVGGALGGGLAGGALGSALSR